jgi:shikimate dehydrogenase
VRITPSTRLYALLGNPVGHSLSPAIHNAAFNAVGADAVYVALRVASEHVAPLIASIAQAGGGGNVTIPHKQIAAASVAHPEPVVTRTGACNTFWAEDGCVYGDNTDVAGFRAAAHHLTGSVHGAHSLVLGAGGAARAVVCALLDEDGTVELVARTLAAAIVLRDRLDPEGKRVRVHGDIAAVVGERFDLLVNTTPLGLQDTDPPPVQLESIHPPGAVIDVVCKPDGTLLERTARTLGIAACDGREMLIAQAAAAFERWFNLDAPVDAMREALYAAAD